MPKNNSYERFKMKNAMLTHDRNQLLASWTSPPAVQRSDPDCQWFPALDITKTPAEYLIEVDLPGLNPIEIQITAESGLLSLRGTRLPHLQGGRNMRIERPSGPFIRRIALPEDAQFAAVTTFFHNGVMEIRVPRSQPSSESLQLVE